MKPNLLDSLRPRRGIKQPRMLGIAALFFAGNLFAGDGKISGLVFGDFYYVAANHNEGIEDQNGFWFRRIYFTYDHKLSDAFSTRFRIEMNGAGDFTSSSKLEPVVKDVYLEWKHSRHSIIVGISPTPTWSVVEKIWGYRAVEKTPLDLQRFGSARDFGLSFKGSLDAQKRVNYHFMFGNGSGNGSENNEGKKLMFSLGAKLNKNFFVEGYADFDDRPDHTNRTTLQAFAVYQREDFRIGGQFAHQTRQVTDSTKELKLEIASVFAATQLSERTWAFVRYDRSFDPNPDGGKISYLPFDDSAEANFFLAGLDFAPIDNVHIMPNIETVFYSEVAGGGPDTDVIPRITFYYVWK